MQEPNYLAIGIGFTVTGMIVVFTGLLILYGAMILFQRLDTLLVRAQERKQQRLVGAHQPTHGGTDQLTPEMVAVIAAAVTTALGKKVRVRRVRYRATEGTAWSRQGRISIMASRVVRR